MPRSHRKMDFSAPLDSKRQSSLMVDLLDAISREGARYPDVLKLCSLGRRFIARPDLLLFNQLCSATIANASCEEEAYLISQCVALFKKRSDIELGIDKQQVALDAFVRSERLCSIVNRKLRHRDDPDYRERATLIFQMQRKISQCLGSCPPIEDLPSAFGPGTNVGCSKNTSVRRKLMADATATEAALFLFEVGAPSSHVWPGLSQPKVVNGSYWTSVAKTALTDRGINVEPIINAYVQKGIGQSIRGRLRNVGIDLNDQCRNQRLAREGSLSGDLATIDLSMASDMISYLLVMDLLPLEWFVLLDGFRSPECNLPDGTVRVLEKFSSMGNGATFELESLIFWAVLAVSCPADSVISVYGDDLICPVSSYDSVCRNLELLGFIVNKSKSFSDGPFRESCGKDYWLGTDIRPCFLKTQWSVKEIYRFHNYIVRTGRLQTLLPVLLSYIPKGERLFGPDGFGDGHLLWTDEPRFTVDKRGWEPFHVIRTYTAKPRTCNDLLASDFGACVYKTTHTRTDPQEQYIPAEKAILGERCQAPRYRITKIRVPAAL